jgi:hypothetical protein
LRFLIFSNFVSYIYVFCYAHNWNSYIKAWENEFIKETLKKSVLSKMETFDEEEIDIKTSEVEDEEDFNKLGNFLMSTSSELVETNYERKAFFGQDYYSSVFLAQMKTNKKKFRLLKEDQATYYKEAFVILTI